LPDGLLDLIHHYWKFRTIRPLLAHGELQVIEGQLARLGLRIFREIEAFPGQSEEIFSSL
jgi:hypothetical protein